MLVRASLAVSIVAVAQMELSVSITNASKPRDVHKVFSVSAVRCVILIAESVSLETVPLIDRVQTVVDASTSSVKTPMSAKTQASVRRDKSVLIIVVSSLMNVILLEM